MLHVLQICNVGQIVGGTAACAWTVTHALPSSRHTVVFLSPVSGETRAAFRHGKWIRADRIDRRLVEQIDPDVILMHNTPASRVDGPLPSVVLQYAHSRVAHAPADATVYCSRWLAKECGEPEGRVLHQAAPIPPFINGADSFSGVDGQALPGRRALRDRPVIGRLCTPQGRKWPEELIDFSHDRADRFPQVDWEFVGCPLGLQERLRRACEGRATFAPASWEARACLHRWDALLYHHPTLTESFGRTCAEALRAGCLPIVDARGGFVEQLTNEAGDVTAGFLCADASDFDAAIDRLLDPGVRWRMSRHARTHGESRFTLARFADELLRLFHDVASHVGPSEPRP